MTPLKEIGECLVIDGDDEYFYRPSLIAMSSIGEPGEIVSTFHALHCDEATPLLRRAYDAYGAIPHWVIEHARRPEFTQPALYAAMDVLTACCNRDASLPVSVLVPSKTKKRPSCIARVRCGHRHYYFCPFADDTRHYRQG